MLQIALLNYIPGGSQVIECRLHVARIPDGDDIEQEAQTGRAVELTGEIAIGEHATLPIGDIASQTVDRLSLIEHTPDLAPMRLVRNEGEHVDRAEDTPVFLQSTMDQVLVIESLQFVGEQNGCHRPIFEGSGNAMHVVPAPHNQIPPDGWSSKERL